MATPIFPATLPNVIMSDYGYTPGNNLIRTEMETGPAKVRRRFVSVPTKVNGTWKFTRDELKVFESFFHNQLFDGAAWFKIKLVNGTGETECTARFEAPYEATTLAREHLWQVRARMEVFGLPTP